MSKPTPRNPGRPVDATQARPSAEPKGGELMSKEKMQLPDYIKDSGQARGSENVGTRDITIPRIEVVQALSKCLKESEPGYIEGAKQGNLYNSLTRALYGSSVIFVPVFYKKEFLIWVDRKKGGAGGTGFRGAHDTEEAALRAKKVLEDADKCEVNETHQQFGLLVHNGGIDELVISMAKSKLKTSRNFNSLIRLNGGDRFSRAYRISTVEESNDKGDFWNFQVANHGFPTREAYEKAERLYEMIAAGRADVDRTYDAADDEAAGHAAEM